MHLLKTFVLATSLAVIAGAQAAAAPLVTGVGSTFLVGVNGSTGDITASVDNFLSGTARFTVTAWAGDSVTFTVNIANTSSTATGFASRITAFGFNVDPDVIAGSSVSGAFSRVVLNDTMSAHGLPKVLGGASDVCLKNGSAPGCESGTGGIAQGASASSTLVLKFASLPASVAFKDFFVRYQGVDTPTATGLSGAGIATCHDGNCTDGDTPPPVPEPTVLVLLGAALFGAAYMRRRSQR